MSDIDRTRMIPLHIADQAVAACDAEIAKLRDEVERLEAWKREAETQLKLSASFVNQANTVIHKLTKAGDNLVFVSSENPVAEPFVKAWNAARDPHLNA